MTHDPRPWWIVVPGGKDIGPFESLDLAIEVRVYVEQVDAPQTYACEQRGVGEPLDAEAQSERDLLLSADVKALTDQVWSMSTYWERAWSEVRLEIGIAMATAVLRERNAARSAAPAPLTLAELGDLPVGSVVLDGRNKARERGEHGWQHMNSIGEWRSRDVYATGPVRLLHRGEQS